MAFSIKNHFLSCGLHLHLNLHHPDIIENAMFNDYTLSSKYYTCLIILKSTSKSTSIYIQDYC